MVTVIFGNQRRPICAGFSRENGVRSGPSSRTGVTRASDFSAIIAAPS